MTIRTKLHILFHSRRLILMITGVVLVYLLSWQFGIKRTVILFMRLSEVSRTARLQQEQIAQPEELFRHLENLDRIMGCSDLTGIDIRQAILDQVSQEERSYPFSMVDIPKGYIYEKQGYTVMVNTFVMAGEYSKLLRLMYNMDTSRTPGQVIASRMFTYKTYQAAEPELRMALYFQHLKKKYDTQ